MSRLRCNVIVKNVTENKIDEDISQLSFKRMTHVCGLKHEITCTNSSNQIMFAISMIPGHDTLSVLDVRAARFHCPGKGVKKEKKG